MEGLFFDLKEMLKPNGVHAANPKAIAMQVYAADCVYNALSVAQGEVAAACHCGALCDLWFAEAQRANPGRRLRKPAPTAHRFAAVPLDAILFEPRAGLRKQRRFCNALRKWKSLSHVRGGRRLLKLS